MKNENWVIWHDNGIPGQDGFSDGYKSELECVSAVEQMKESGITVYGFWRAK